MTTSGQEGTSCGTTDQIPDAITREVLSGRDEVQHLLTQLRLELDAAAYQLGRGGVGLAKYHVEDAKVFLKSLEQELTT